MMRSARPFILGLALLQTACGFAPVYGDHPHSAPVADEMNAVAIESISDRQGQMLRNDLIDRMYGKGRPSAARYSLQVSLHVTTQDLGIQADNSATRSLMDTSADYVLRDSKQKEILKGTAHSVSSYNKLENQYGSLVASESAAERTINEVSEQIVNRLNLYFAERAEMNSAPTNLDNGEKDKTKTPAAVKQPGPDSNE